MAIKANNVHSSYSLPGVFSSAANYLADRQKTSATEGDMYYDTTLNQLRTYDGSSWSAAGQSGTSAGSLDDAASVGAKITNTQAIEIEATSSSSNLFILDANGTTNVDILDISSAGGTGDLINLTQAGTGVDIRGTSDTWRITKAGLLTLDGASAGLTIGDDTPLAIGGSSDITFEWDQTRLLIDAAAADSVVRVGATNNIDLIIYGDTSTDLVTFDTSAEDVQLNGFDLTIMDDDILNFGDSDDVTIRWDQTRLLVDAAAADTAIRIGATNNMDVVIYGDTSTDAVTFDTSAEELGLNGFDLRINDDDILEFGDAADVTIYWDQTKLNIIPAADDTVLQLGAAATAFDLTWQSGTAGDYVLFDASANRVEVVDIDIRLDDSAKLLLGSSADGGSTDGALYWDQTNLQLSAGGANLQINDDVIIGEGGSNENLTVNGNLTVTGNLDLTGGLDVGSQALADTETLTFGTGSDLVMQWDGENFLIEAGVENTGQIEIGGSNAIDVLINASNTANEALFDVSEAILDMNGWDINLQDDDFLRFGDADDITINWDQTSLAIDAQTQANQIEFGKTAGKEPDVVLHGITGKDFYWDATNSQAIVKDDATLAFGNASDITISWDQTRLNIDAVGADQVIRVGSSNNIDLVIYGDTSTDAVTFDTSAEEVGLNGFDLRLYDDDVLEFGDAGDITMMWDQTKMVINAAAADSAIHFGAANYNLDVVIFGDTTTDAVTFDTSAEDININGFDISMNDDDLIKFGDSDDITMTWDQTKFVIDGAAADVEIAIGKTNNLDVVIYGDTTTDAITFDTSAESMDMNGFDLSVNDDDLIKFGDADDITITWDQTELAINAAAANNSINIGKTTVCDFTLNGATAGADFVWDASDDTGTFLDDGKLAFGDADDITISWDQTQLLIDGAAADTAIWIGKTNNQDIIIYGDTTTDAITFDTSAESVAFNGFDLTMEDDDVIKFGDGADITMTWDQTQFLIDGAAADSAVWFGKTNNLDLIIYGDTTTDAITIDTSAEDVDFNGFDLSMNDDDIIRFGDSNDVTMTWDQTQFLIDAAAADSAVWFGKTNNMDLIIYGDTTTDTVTFDTSAESVALNGFDLTMQDDDLIKFGDSGAESTIASDGTNTDWTISSGALTIGDGGTTNYISISTAGSVTLTGSAQILGLASQANGLGIRLPVYAGGAGDPGTTGSALGNICWNSGDNKLYCYDGTNWLATAALS